MAGNSHGRRRRSRTRASVAVAVLLLTLLIGASGSSASAQPALPSCRTTLPALDANSLIAAPAGWSRSGIDEFPLSDWLTDLEPFLADAPVVQAEYTTDDAVVVVTVFDSRELGAAGLAFILSDLFTEDARAQGDTVRSSLSLSPRGEVLDFAFGGAMFTDIHPYVLMFSTFPASPPEEEIVAAQIDHTTRAVQAALAEQNASLGAAAKAVVDGGSFKFIGYRAPDEMSCLLESGLAEFEAPAFVVDALGDYRVQVSMIDFTAGGAGALLIEFILRTNADAASALGGSVATLDSWEQPQQIPDVQDSALATQEQLGRFQTVGAFRRDNRFYQVASFGSQRADTVARVSEIATLVSRSLGPGESTVDPTGDRRLTGAEEAGLLPYLLGMLTAVVVTWRFATWVLGVVRRLRWRPSPPTRLVRDISHLASAFRMRGYFLLGLFLYLLAAAAVEIYQGRFVTAAGFVAVFLITLWVLRRHERQAGAPGFMRSIRSVSVSRQFISVVFAAIAVALLAGAYVNLSLSAVEASTDHTILFYESPEEEAVRAIAFVPALLLGFAVAQVARRLRVGSMSQLARVDKRDFVLYLRSFRDDGRKVRSSLTARMGVADLLRIRASTSLEEVLVWQANALGPVVAIGRPKGRVGAFGARNLWRRRGISNPRRPIGAARELLPEKASWVDVVESYMENAAAIVLLADSTDGLNAELDLIIAGGHEAKTVVVIPPARLRSQGGWQLVESLADRFAIGPIEPDPSRIALAMANLDSTAPMIFASRRDDELAFRVALDEALMLSMSSADCSIGRAAELAEAVLTRTRSESELGATVIDLTSAASNRPEREASPR